MQAETAAAAAPLHVKAAALGDLIGDSRRCRLLETAAAAASVHLKAATLDDRIGVSRRYRLLETAAPPHTCIKRQPHQVTLSVSPDSVG